jgi:hypothetical protein
MQIEDTYIDTRWAACSECGWGGDTDIDIVAYYGTEIGDWVCPECQSVNEYRNDTAWDRADELHDRMKEEQEWQNH